MCLNPDAVCMEALWGPRNRRWTSPSVPRLRHDNWDAGGPWRSRIGSRGRQPSWRLADHTYCRGGAPDLDAVFSAVPLR